MPSTAEHLSWGCRHLTTAQHVRTLEDPSWAVVLMFYSAHGLAHAVFAADPTLRDVARHPEKHKTSDFWRPGTNDVLQRDYQQIWRDYRDLYSQSIGVRYQGSVVPRERIEEAHQRLRKVGAWARRELHRCCEQAPDWIPG